MPPRARRPRPSSASVAGENPSVNRLIYISSTAAQVGRDAQKTLWIRGIATHVHDDYIIEALRQFGNPVLVARLHWLAEKRRDGAPNYDMVWVELSTLEEAASACAKHIPSHRQDEYRGGSHGTGELLCTWTVRMAITSVQYPRKDASADPVRLVHDSTSSVTTGLGGSQLPHATPAPEAHGSTIRQEEGETPTTPGTSVKQRLATPGTSLHRTAVAPRGLSRYDDENHIRVGGGGSGFTATVHGAPTPSRVLQLHHSASESASNSSVTASPAATEQQLHIKNGFEFLLIDAKFRCRKYVEATTTAASTVQEVFTHLGDHAHSAEERSQLLVLNAAFLAFCKDQTQLMLVSHHVLSNLRFEKETSASVLNDALNIALLLLGLVPTEADRIFQLIKAVTYPRKSDSSFSVAASSVAELGIHSDGLPEMIMFGLGPLPILERIA